MNINYLMNLKEHINKNSVECLNAESSCDLLSLLFGTSWLKSD